jgi:hypothetical protein
LASDNVTVIQNSLVSSMDVLNHSTPSEPPGCTDIEIMHRIAVELALNVTGQRSTGLFDFGIPGIQIDVTGTREQVRVFLIFGSEPQTDLPVK